MSSKNSNVRESIAVKNYEAEKPRPLEDIDKDTLMVFIKSEIDKKGIAGHHLRSMNNFYGTGIRQIVTEGFQVESTIKNKRAATEEDSQINDINFSVKFTGANLTSPITIKPRATSTEALFPNEARVKNQTYSAQLHLDMEITATAYLKTGQTIRREAEIKNHHAANIPVAIRSQLCNTYKLSRDTLRELNEDPDDYGGTFIISGNKWVVDNSENLTQNTLHAYANRHLNELARGEFLSKPGDAFENSYHIIIRYLNNGGLTIEMQSNKSDKLELPFYVLFRLCGISSDREIADHIVYGVDNVDPVTKFMLSVLDRAFHTEETKYRPLRHVIDVESIANFIAAILQPESQNANALKDDNIAKYVNTSVLNLVDKYLFPHIGKAVSDRVKKMRFMGHLINHLLKVNMGVLEETDRDSLRNKRIHPAGTSLSKAFKTLFNHSCIQSIRSELADQFRSTQFKTVDLAATVKGAFSNDLERALMQSIKSGNKTMVVGPKEIKNRVLSQIVIPKCSMNIISTLNTITTPNSSAAKKTTRAADMRKVHSTYLGFICPAQSADTGEKVGMNKQMACTASIAMGTSSRLLKDIVLADDDIIELDKVTAAAITRERLAKVFVNGDWVGCCKNAFTTARKYREGRRRGDIHHETTIVSEIAVRELKFWTDVGRLLRPLIIVYNNIDEYIAAKRNKQPVEFKQWTLLTRDHIRGLGNKTVTMDMLREQRVIEYIAPEEQENAYIAANYEILRENSGNVLRQFTHVDVEQAILGLIALAAPLACRSQSSRTTMYTNHRKQATGWLMNYPHTFEKNLFIQYYCHQPLIKSVVDEISTPNQQNAVVALMIYTGDGQEDSIIVNKSSIQCGMFNGVKYYFEEVRLEKGEHFGLPNSANTMDEKDADYSKIDPSTGVIRIGSRIKKNDVLIAKLAKMPKNEENYEYTDHSLVYKHDEDAVIDDVIIGRGAKDETFAKVKIRYTRPLIVGDKLSSRSGNKGIVAREKMRSEMPYCEDGLVPDLIVNCHSIPTRMALNQIIEGIYGEIAARRGQIFDMTIFKKLNIDWAIKTLEELGVKNGCHKQMYDARTGYPMKQLVFIAPTSYQRLQKFVLEESYAMRTGPTVALTRQPLEGKLHDGGFRLGEMEKDVICGHGTGHTLDKKFNEDSDGAKIPFCTRCGNRAVVNESKQIYLCKYCEDLANIAMVPSTWVANLFFNELGTANVKMKFGLSSVDYDNI